MSSDRTDENLTERVTLRVSKDHVEALDALVDAGRFKNRSQALRVGVEEVLDDQAVMISEESAGGRERKHLPDGDGGTLCSILDDDAVIEATPERAAHLDLCRGCDPAVDIDHANDPGTSVARSVERGR